MKITQNVIPFLSEAKVRNEIKIKYGFEPVHCILMGHLRSSIFLITNEYSNYIFKIYGSNFHQLESIKGEVELLNILQQQGAAVSFAIKDINNEQIQEFNTAEGLCYGILFSYAEGEQSPIMTANQLIALGRELAKIHKITAGLKLKNQLKEYDINTMLIIPLKEIKPAFRDRKDEYKYLLEIGSYAIKKIKQLKRSHHQYCYIHYDLSSSNIHFDHQNKVTFFDFDIAGKGLPIQDIVAINMHHFNLVRTGKISKEEANEAFKLFLNSYQTISKVDDLEMETMPYFGFGYLLFGMHLIIEHFEEYSYQEYLKDRLLLIKLWVDQYIIV